MRIHDLSPPIHPGLAVWPGDVPFSRDVALSIAAGANLDLSSIRATLHLGAHADAPSHYVGGGAGIGERSLDPYLGPCHVLRPSVGRGERVTPAHFSAPLSTIVRAPRVLFHTGTFPAPDAWNSDFASLSPEIIDDLAAAGVRLVGIDTPSIDPQDDRDLHAHHAVARHDLCVLEGLVLSNIPEGVYTLIALPLRILGADASPVRAILVEGDAFASGKR